MKQEYLLLNIHDKQKISNYKPERVGSKLFSVENGKCWYAEFSNNENNLKTAKSLAEVDEYVRNNFQVITLQNDSSKYLNDRLYPLMSSFERKLRKILYMFSAINKDDESAKNIEKLEEKDFGQIFTMLFIDDGFMSAAKTIIKETKRETFSKEEIIHILESIDEKTVWDKLLGKNIVPTLRKEYQFVREARNDIMHSHDIRWGKYQKAEKLIRKINRELDEAIDDVQIKENITKSQHNFNKTLSDALRVQEQIARAYDKSMVQIQNELANTFNPDFVRLAQMTQQMETAFPWSKEMEKAIEQSRNLTNSIGESQELLKATENAQKMADLYRENPSLVEAERRIERISNMVEENPAILAIQNQARYIARLSQTWDRTINNGIIDKKSNDNDGGLKNGENENGIDGYDGSEHREN